MNEATDRGMRESQTPGFRAGGNAIIGKCRVVTRPNTWLNASIATLRASSLILEDLNIGSGANYSCKWTIPTHLGFRTCTNSTLLCWLCNCYSLIWPPLHSTRLDVEFPLNYTLLNCNN